MKRLLPLWICCSLFLCCIGEDFVDDYIDPNLRITNAIISIREGLSYQFQALFFDESGREVNNPTLEWSAIPPTAVEIQPNGTLKALSAGNVILTVSTIGLQGNTIEASFSFEITPKVISEVATTTSEVSTSTTDTATTTTDTATTTTNNSTTTSDTATTTTETSTSTTETASSTSDTSSSTDSNNDNSDHTDGNDQEDQEDEEDEEDDNGIVVAPQFFEGQIRTTSSYTLKGNFRYEHNGTQIILSLDDTYRASSSLPGLYLYLTNNPNSPEDGYEVGAVTVFAGAHSYNLPSSINLMDYKYLLYWCKPFRVKVGDAQLFD